MERIRRLPPSAEAFVAFASQRPSLPRPEPTQEPGLIDNVIDLSEHCCKWPLGEPGEAGFTFCGRKTKGKGSYCEAHAAIGTVKARARRRKSLHDGDAAKVDAFLDHLALEHAAKVAYAHMR